MKDSQGNILFVGDKLKSSESRGDHAKLQLIELHKDYGVFKRLGPLWTNLDGTTEKEYIKLTNESINNSKWIVVKQSCRKANTKGKHERQKHNDP